MTRIITKYQSLQPLPILMRKFSNQITIQGVRDSTKDNVLANQGRDIEAFRAWCELGHENEWSIELDQRTKNFQNVL